MDPHWSIGSYTGKLAKVGFCEGEGWGGQLWASQHCFWGLALAQSPVALLLLGRGGVGAFKGLCSPLPSPRSFGAWQRAVSLHIIGALSRQLGPWAQSHPFYNALPGDFEEQAWLAVQASGGLGDSDPKWSVALRPGGSMLLYSRAGAEAAWLVFRPKAGNWHSPHLKATPPNGVGWQLVWLIIKQ